MIRNLSLVGSQADGTAPVAWPCRADRIERDGSGHARRQAAERATGRRALAGDGHRTRRVRRAGPIVVGLGNSCLPNQNLGLREGFSRL